MESVEAMSRYKFHIIREFVIRISHALMTHPEADQKRIDTIMTHPHALELCKKKLAKKYPRHKLMSVGGELTDSALVAQRLSEGKLPSTIAIMGSPILSQTYGLRVIEENLDDRKENYTSFLWVERPG